MKNLLITGASQGIGKATAIEAAKKACLSVLIIIKMKWLQMKQ